MIYSTPLTQCGLKSIVSRRQIVRRDLFELCEQNKLNARMCLHIFITFFFVRGDYIMLTHASYNSMCLFMQKFLSLYGGKSYMKT